MDLSARNPEAPGAVTAALTYLVDTGVKPVNYPSVAGEDGVSRWDGGHEERSVAIHDGRAAAEPFDLDREGFALVRHDTAVTDFYDDAEIETVYEAEVEKLVKEVTGARRVVVFDHGKADFLRF